MTTPVRNTDIRRIFAAVDFPKHVIFEIMKMQSSLEKMDVIEGRWTRPENLHLTLRFLGELPSDRLDAVREFLGNIDFSPFNINFKRLGVFSMRSEVRVLWIQIRGEGLIDLQEKIDASAADCHDTVHQYVAHLTLARVSKVVDKKRLRKLLQDFQVYSDPFEVSSFALKESIAASGAAAYRTLATFGR